MLYNILDCIWEAGVGVLHSPPSDSVLDNNRTELLRLLITLASETLYAPPPNSGPVQVFTQIFMEFFVNFFYEIFIRETRGFR